jgi:hypothetical protein
MRVVDVSVGGADHSGYTAFIPESWLDSLALRRIPGLERVTIPILAMRDLAAGVGDGTCLVRKWPKDRIG